MKETLPGPWHEEKLVSTTKGYILFDGKLYRHVEALEPSVRKLLKGIRKGLATGLGAPWPGALTTGVLYLMSLQRIGHQGSDWLTRSGSVRLFSLAGVIVLASGLFMLGLFEISKTQIYSLLEASVIFRVFCGLVGVIAFPAAIYLSVGMLWYWAQLDTAARPHKILWFIFFLISGFFGLAIYSLTVYRKQMTVQTIVAAHR